jgi:hypothetical protein
MDVLKRLMLRIEKAKPVNMDGVFESDEIYVTAVLKGRSNSLRIKRFGSGLKRRGR